MMKTFAVVLGLASTLGLAILPAQNISRTETQSVPSPDQQALERFFAWLDTVKTEQLGNDAVVPYRQYLKSRGLSDAEVARELDLVEQAHARMEVDYWNRVLTAPTPRFNTKPNAFLTEIARNRKPG